MAIVRVSVLIQVDADDDVEEFRTELLNAVQHGIKNNPDQFLITELDEDDEVDWEEIESHDGFIDWDVNPVHPSFDPVFKNER